MICLLCLKENANVQSSIAYNSTEWQDLNIQHILEKYLWKMEHLNNHSYMCQACWKELCNFHKFYTKIEEAHSNLSLLIKSEVVSDVGFSEEGELAEKKLSIGTENAQLEPEFLLFKEETSLELFEKEEIPLELFEKEDDNEAVDTLEKTPKRKRSKSIKSKNDLQNTPKSNCKTRFSKKKITTDVNKSGTAKSNSKKKRSRKKITTDVNKSASDLNQDKSGIKLEAVENDCKETNLDEDIDNQNDTRFESDDVLLSVASSKLQLEEDDKFISEHMELTCSLCQIPLDTFSILIKHYKDQHNERGYAICCNRKFYQRSVIIDHIKLHQNPEYFKCRHCHKILCGRYGLKLHMKTVHDQKNIDCDSCGKTFSTPRALKMHKLSHNEDRLPCKHCGKSYLTIYSLANHIRTVHLKKYHQICDLCGVSISGEISFNRHMLAHEGKKLPMVSCEVCGRLLSDKGTLKRHMASHHPPEGTKAEFKCHICSKVFAVPTNLKKHIKVVHETTYVKKCELCEKIIRTPKALRDHMAMHVGKPLNVCDFCPKTFYSSGVKYAHQKRAHPTEWRESARKNYSGDLPEKFLHKNKTY